MDMPGVQLRLFLYHHFTVRSRVTIVMGGVTKESKIVGNCEIDWNVIMYLHSVCTHLSTYMYIRRSYETNPVDSGQTHSVLVKIGFVPNYEKKVCEDKRPIEHALSFARARETSR